MQENLWKQPGGDAPVGRSDSPQRFIMADGKIHQAMDQEVNTVQVAWKRVYAEYIYNEKFSPSLPSHRWLGLQKGHLGGRAEPLWPKNRKWL